MNALSIANVSFTYLDAARPALRDLTLDIPDGQICGVIGRAGSGKSTLCALCTGFIPNFYNGQFSGTAMVDGQNVVQKSVSELVRHVGLVSSNPFSQISGSRFSVYEEVALGLENLGVPRDEIVERVDWALEALGISHLRDRSPFALSGGQQQRMVIAGTLALRPPVLVLDEPTTQLDPPSIIDLAEILRSLARQGTTIVFAEHRLEWAADLADRIVVLHEGALIGDGPPAAVLTDPALLERGVGWPRPALIARRLRDEGRWAAGTPLPVTDEALLAELGSAESPRATGGERPTTGGEQPTASNHKPSGSYPSGAGGPAPVVELRDVRFSYPSGVEALRGVSLRIGAGERVAILGRNGAGKSTLVRHLNGLLRPSAGMASVAGIDTRTTTVATCARHVGIVFQDVRNQLFARTVRDELRFGPKNLRYSAARVEQLVENALETLGLSAVAQEHPYDLPLAQRRLVAIAAVLAMDTPVLVLDEPTAGLDNAMVAMLDSLAKRLADDGRSAVVVSHDLDFCYEALDRVVLVRDGLVVLDTRWDSLDAPALALMEEVIGLPLALRVAQVANRVL